jgi:glycosyltransferase involved in cell wall biosynthesis
VVHVVTEGPLGWSAVAAARRMGLAVTSGFHTNFDRYSVHYGLGWLRPAVAAYLRSLHRRTRATLVPTEALAADLAGEGIPGVCVVGRGVDTDLFNPRRRSRDLRETWGVGERDLACLYVGRLAPEKNLDDACRAFDTLCAARPGARMVWVGDGPAAAHLRRVRPRDHFAGTRTGAELAAHYASADLFLFGSLTETYGNVVAEAMASGLAVTAYRSAAAAELIQDGFSGRTAPPGDSYAFTAAALGLALDDDLRRAAGLRARLDMESRGWPAVVERFEGVLRQAAVAHS